MDALSFLVFMSCVEWLTNISDYFNYSDKHRRTQAEIQALRNEIVNLNNNINKLIQKPNIETNN